MAAPKDNMNCLENAEHKLEVILERLLSEETVSRNSESYLDILISHLSKPNDNKFHALLQRPFVLDWIEKCVNLVADDANKIPRNIVAFLLKLSSLLTKNESLFTRLEEKNTLKRIQLIIESNANSLNPSIKLAHIRLLAAACNHRPGLAWIRSNNSWTYLINYCNENHTAYVVREATALIYDIIYKLTVQTDDEKLCIEILTEILKPMQESGANFENSLTVRVDDSDLQVKLSPTFDLISYVLQKTIESEMKTKIVHLCETHFNLEMSTWKFVDMTQNHVFLEKILKVLTSYNYAKLVYDKWNYGQIESIDFNQFGVTFFNLMKFCIERRACANVLKLAELNHVLWRKLGSRVPEEILIENEKIQFENQLITFHLLPLLATLKLNKDEPLFDDYIMKLFSITCEFNLRLCYSFRDILVDCPEKANELAFNSIHGILSMQNMLDQGRAVLVFQAMCYALKDFISCPDERRPETDFGLILKKPNVLHAVLIGLQTLIKRYRISWKESIETVCVVNFMLILLKDANLSTRLAIQAIKMTQLSIEHFLSPNMALLMDNLNGSALQNLGPIIKKLIHDNAWEVRDSILELVTSIATISRLKYPAFQQYLLDHGIPSEVYAMAKDDVESFVRASALKCVTQMVPINLLWEKSLNTLDITEHVLNVLCNETEGIVRKEAVLLITKVYDIRKIPANRMDVLLSTLCHCAVNDLHWEVKINALYFWKTEICRQFTNQGMIDGTFPNVTFSKEYKKIVTLTENEILLRIQKILSNLSQCGCLGVLLRCLDDDCDLEVLKVTIVITKKLIENLEKYDFDKILEHSNKTVGGNEKSLDSVELSDKPSTGSSTTQTPASNSDDVIDSIITSFDINLLATAYESGKSSNGILSNEIDVNLYKTFAKVSPYEFLKTIKDVELDSLTKKRSNLILHTACFNSLLDDVLQSTRKNGDGTNDSDCY